MSSIIEISDLAIDRRGRRFAPHPEATQWQPERITGGQPVAVTRYGERVYVKLSASYEDFEEAVGYVAGWYRLRQVTDKHTVLDAPSAYIEIQGVNLGSAAQRVGVEEALGLCGRMMQANEHKDALMTDVMKTMLQTHVQLQMGAVKMLEVVGNTIPIASGIQAVERPAPTIDIDEMAGMLLEAMDEQREESEDAPRAHWFERFMEFLDSPNGKLARTMASNLVLQFVQTYAQAKAPKKQPD